MTRINVVPPSELTREHLIAEYHELPRVFNYVLKLVEQGKLPHEVKAPTEYVLGTGHVKFFAVRLAYIVKRHADLIAEMQGRGYKPNFPALKFLKLNSKEWYGDYKPTRKAIALNRARIKERLEL